MAKVIRKYTFPCIEAKQPKRPFILTKLPASVLTEIAYASVRNIDKEEGAVQRLLEAGRIREIKSFILDGGEFPASIILNWVSTTNPIVLSHGTMNFKVGSRLAQLVDGQHRVEGLRAAMEDNASIAKMEIPVTVYRGLTTQECADIFISINDKQTKVKKSLVVDLYDVASDYVVDIVAQRARDLAELLNTEKDSPYFEYIKFPNSPRNAFGIPLSTVVTNIKPLVETDGIFEQVGLVELEMQKGCILNFFNVLKNWYGKNRWEDRSNVFLAAAGFTGAIDFLKLTMLPYCNLAEDFTADYMNKALDLNPATLIERSDIKGIGGRAAWNKVNQLLKQRFKSPSTKKNVRV